jgi:hypothetical protein
MGTDPGCFGEMADSDPKRDTAASGVLFEDFAWGAIAESLSRTIIQ